MHKRYRPLYVAFFPWQPSDHLEAFTVRLVFTVILVRWRVQEHQSEDVEVPHPVDAGEEGAVHLYRYVPPLPVAFGHLPGRKQTHTGWSVRPNSVKIQKWCPKAVIWSEISKDSINSTEMEYNSFSDAEGRLGFSSLASICRKKKWSLQNYCTRISLTVIYHS